MSNHNIERDINLGRDILRTCYSSPTSLCQSRFFSSLWFARPQTNLSVACFVKHKGTVFRSVTITPQTKILTRQGMYLFFRLRARSIIASELSSKKTNFRTGAHSTWTFLAEFVLAVHIPVEGINRARRCFLPDFPT